MVASRKLKASGKLTTGIRSTWGRSAEVATEGNAVAEKVLPTSIMCPLAGLYTA